MNPPETQAYHLVHANVASARAPLDAPLMQDFVALIDEINRLASIAPGFIAQPVLPDAGAVFTPPLLLNVSIWQSTESLDAFTHRDEHAAALERRAEWFH